MSFRRCCLLVVLAALVGGYLGFLYAERSTPWSRQQLQITGMGSKNAVELMRTVDGAKPNTDAPLDPIESEISPMIAALECEIAEYSVEFLGEGLERVNIPLAELSPMQLRCLLDAANRELEGPQYAPMATLPRPPSHRPLSVTLENSSTDAQTH